MRNRIVSRVFPQWVSCLLLLAFVFRALIPSGFMPAAGLPFTLQICPDGFPIQLLPGAGEHAGHASHGAMGATAHPEHAAHLAQLDGSRADTQPGTPSHQHHTTAGEHCLFGAAASVGPAAHLLVDVTSSDVDDVVIPAAAAPMYPSRPHRFAQPRAPPAFS